MAKLKKTAADAAPTETKPTDGDVKIRGQHPKAPIVGFDWAANKTKLAHAIAHVKATTPALVQGSSEHEAAVKERYTSLKGRLVEDGSTPGKKGAKKGGVVNLADDDGSEDIDNDE